MGQSHRQDAEKVTIVTPNVLENDILEIIDGMACVPEADAAIGDSVSVWIRGIFTQAKAAGYAVTVGETLYWDVADQEFNSDTGNPAVGSAIAAAGSSDTAVEFQLFPLKVIEAASLTTRIDALEAKVDNGGTLEVRVDALEALALDGGALDLRVDALELNKIETFTGAGDQIACTTTGATVFTKKATIDADAAAVDDFCEWEAEVFVDSTDSTPQATVKLLLGTAELDSIVIATAAANDYVLIKGHGRITAATTMRMWKSRGETKDGTLSLHTHAAAADVTIQALSSARDVTCSVTCDAGHADNKFTLKSLRFEVKKH